jgi:SAM-dependent methyltransferase|tara:strand:- start:1012 stop:1599 length:588 start_codon:yes stop_codon:yes gene_type:complete
VKHKGINLALDKRKDKNTTSHKFKKDLIDLFKDSKWNREGSVLEVSCHKGYTTSILSRVFNKVYAVDFKDSLLEHAKKYNKGRSNIEFFAGDVYRPQGWEGLPNADVVFIDCVHDYKSVMSDIENALKHFKKDGGLLIFDDYGLPGVGVNPAVKESVKSNKNLSVFRHIGEPKGSDCRPGVLLKDWEGIILRYKS